MVKNTEQKLKEYEEINPSLFEIKRLLQGISILKDSERERGINIIIKRIDNLISQKVRYSNILSKFIIQIDREIGEGSSTPDFKEGFIIGFKRAEQEILRNISAKFDGWKDWEQIRDKDGVLKYFKVYYEDYLNLKEVLTKNIFRNGKTNK